MPIFTTHNKVDFIDAEDSTVKQSALLSKNYSFHIIAFNMMENNQADIKVKTLNRTHLSDVYQDFEDAQKYRNDNHLILVGNQRLIKHSGTIRSEEVQALIGYAVKRKWLPFRGVEMHDPKHFIVVEADHEPRIIQAQ